MVDVQVGKGENWETVSQAKTVKTARSRHVRKARSQAEEDNLRVRLVMEGMTVYDPV